MRKWQISFGFSLIILALTCTCFSADGYNYGKMWLKWSEDTRLTWVWGFTEGQSTILEEINVNQKVKRTFKFDVSGSDAGVISDIMVGLYGDASNTYIPWRYMTYVAQMKLKGSSGKEVESELQLLRQYADYERSKLQKK